MLVAWSRLMRGEVATSTLVKQGLVVGRRFGREGGVRIDPAFCHLITIGDDVILAPMVHILAHDASLKRFAGVVRAGRVRIGDRVFIGAGTIVLPGVAIGDDVVVGAGSVVSGDLAAGAVYAGNPARQVRSLSDYVAKAEAQMQARPVIGRETAPAADRAGFVAATLSATTDGFCFFEAENSAEFSGSPPRRTSAP